MTEPLTGGLAGASVLVSGGTGFVGSHLVAVLVAEGAMVTVLGPGLGWREPVLDLVRSGRVRFVPIRAFWSPVALRRLSSRIDAPDHFVHLAYAPPTSDRDAGRSIHEVERNVLGSLRLVQALAGESTTICFASSAKVYGSSAPCPVAESDAACPDDAYGMAKLAVEHQLRLLSEQQARPVTALRFSTVYGPMETVSRAVPNFIRRALAGHPAVLRGDGQQRSDYVHVSDVVQAVMRALVRPGGGFAALNVASGYGVTALELAERVRALVGNVPEPEYSPEPGGADLVCDISRAQREMLYAPRMELGDGLAEEVAWFAARPALWDRGI